MYLGSKVTIDGRSEKEITRRIAIAKVAFIELKKVLTNLRMGMGIRMRVQKSFVWSTLLYGSET